MKLEELYTPQILGLAAAIPNIGRLDAPHGSASLHARLCGSKVTVDVSLKDGFVDDFAIDLSACALAQAACAILGQGLKGETLQGVRGARKALWAMLKQGAPPPEGKWATLAPLAPVRHVPQRHESVLLPFDAAIAAIGEDRS